ncbi:MAG: hypothetical protein GX234_02300 [Clostridiales bacterium]|nr:hypothetical protein [Clostridiales bacterium]
MEKDIHLVNIYLKIHNKQTLTMDDLGYLAQYAPECFEKTCKNVVYNFPEAKPIMEPAAEGVPKDEQEPEPSETQNIEKILENIKRLEAEDFPVTNINVDDVKSLLGNLYMELLFPHNDKDKFMNMADQENKSSFDKKV